MFQQLVNGLTISMIYVLLALGLTIIFGLTRIINFAQGQFLVLGSFLALELTERGVSYWIALVLVPPIVGLFGALLEVTLLRRTVGDPLLGFIATFGLGIALAAIFSKIWTARIFRLSAPVSGAWEIGGVRIGQDRALIVAVSVVALVGLHLLLQRTTPGRHMRAASESREAAALIGLPVRRATLTAFFLGSALAGLAGALLGVSFPFSAFSGNELVVKALGVAVIGGLGSIPGALVAGLGLGVLETMTSAYGLPLGVFKIDATWRDGIVFVCMILVLAWRPNGLFGTVREFGATRQ